jgi:hypothetical protein
MQAGQCVEGPAKSEGVPGTLKDEIGKALTIPGDAAPLNAIFIDAVEVDHGLAAHLVSPDPSMGDKLISLSLSEFAITATVLELGEPAPLVTIIVNHCSCMRFDDLYDNAISPARRAIWAF